MSGYRFWYLEFDLLGNGVFTRMHMPYWTHWGAQRAARRLKSSYGFAAKFRVVRLR